MDICRANKFVPIVEQMGDIGSHARKLSMASCQPLISDFRHTLAYIGIHWLVVPVKNSRAVRIAYDIIVHINTNNYLAINFNIKYRSMNSDNG